MMGEFSFFCELYTEYSSNLLRKVLGFGVLYMNYRWFYNNHYLSFMGGPSEVLLCRRKSSACVPWQKK